MMTRFPFRTMLLSTGGLVGSPVEDSREVVSYKRIVVEVLVAVLKKISRIVEFVPCSNPPVQAPAQSEVPYKLFWSVKVFADGVKVEEVHCQGKAFFVGLFQFIREVGTQRAAHT